MSLSVTRLALAVGLSVFFLTGCQTTPKAKPRQSALEAVPGSMESGLASWYGDAYRGKKTASGERFNPDNLTAAHRTLSFGQWVRVRNLHNDKTVVVRINDRGPFINGRIIDLSEAAAHQIGMVKAGIVPVEVTRLRLRSR